MKSSQTYDYHMKYLVDSMDERPAASTYETSLNKGDIILLSNSLYYCIVAVTQFSHQNTNAPLDTLVLSDSANTPEEAMKNAIDKNYLPKSYSSLLT